MVDSEKKFNMLAIIGPIAAAAVIGVILYVLYPDMGLNGDSYSDNSASSAGTPSQYGDAASGGNDMASQASNTSTPSAPTGPGY